MQCEYPTRTTAEAPLQPCGKPATHQGVHPPNKLYCADHAKQVMKPNGIAVRKIEPETFNIQHSTSNAEGGAQ